MPRQISDEEYNAFVQAQNTVRFIESIYNDPNLNAEAKALIKKKYPNMQIPDLDIRQEVRQMIQQDRDERRQQEEQRERERLDNDAAVRRSSVQKKYGFTDEGMTELEKLMVERNVGDYEVAAEYHVAKNPKPSEATFADNRWDHAKQDGFKEIAADPEAWGRAEIIKALNADQERAKAQRF